MFRKCRGSPVSGGAGGVVEWAMLPAVSRCCRSGSAYSKKVEPAQRLRRDDLRSVGRPAALLVVRWCSVGAAAALGSVSGGLLCCGSRFC